MYTPKLIRILLLLVTVSTAAEAQAGNAWRANVLNLRQDFSRTSVTNEPTLSPTTPTSTAVSTSSKVSSSALETSSTSSTAVSSSEKRTTTSSSREALSTTTQDFLTSTTSSLKTIRPLDTTNPTRPLVSTYVSIVTRTRLDGSKETETTTRIGPTPAVNTDGSKNSSSMSTKTRNTVIGVVVGIGGAVILGSLGLVAWRVWGRKRDGEEADGLMEYDMGTVTREKSGFSTSVAGVQSSPFHSTLEDYHQPRGVNPSSNF